MSLHDVWELTFDVLPQKPIGMQLVKENISIDVGLLIFRQWEEKCCFTEDFPQQLNDIQSNADHSIFERVRRCVFDILVGDVEQNDHDALRVM